jgi:hypothetical protein
MADLGITLTTNQFLAVNDYLVASNNAYFAIMQGDGNFVVYSGSGPSSQGAALWASNSVGVIGPYFVILQADGNLVIYNGAGPSSQGAAIWASNTVGVIGQFFLSIQANGELISYAGTPSSPGNLVWQSGVSGPIPPAAPPTPAQIAQVQTNLTNMQALNDYIYNHSTAKVLNAYFLLTEQDNSDPGLVIGLNILEGAFWAVGSELGPIGNFLASFLSGMVSWWATNTPPSLNTTFANLVNRLSATSQQVDTQLATYYSDVTDNWNVQFTYNGQTQTLANLANITVPAETDPTFESLAAAALFGLDQSIWTTVMVANFVVTLWEASSGPDIMQGSQDQPPVAWDEMFIAANPAYYNTWTWQQGSGCGSQTGWLINEYNIGTGAGVFSDGSMSKDACGYLFIDSADGVVINANGLFSRETVFTGLGIRQTTYYVSTGGAVASALSVGYLKAMKQGSTLGLLIQREGREAVEKRIIEKAHQDSVFAIDLRLRPRETLQNFLGVRIPEVVSVSVVVENPRTFGLVIPMAADTQLK